MTLLEAAFADVGVTRVSDGEYYPAVMRMVRDSRGQCLCSIFIVDHDLNGDPEIRVDRLLVELACATWRGVETKLLIGGSRRVAEIRGASLLAWARAQELGIEARLAAAVTDDASHVKLVVTDTHVLTGSHNWSRGMFGAETQDSVLLKSPALAAAMRTYFLKQWRAVAADEYQLSV